MMEGHLIEMMSELPFPELCLVAMAYTLGKTFLLPVPIILSQVGCIDLGFRPVPCLVGLIHPVIILIQNMFDSLCFLV